LGDRYDVLQKEKKETQDKLNEELRLKIVERTKNQEQLKKLNASLQNTNTDLDNFIYTASHDLKVPITNIEGLINILDTESYSKDELKSMLVMMRKCIEDFTLTVNSLTEITRVQQLRQRDIGVNQINTIVNEVVEKLKSKIKISDAQIKTDTHRCPSIIFSRKNLFIILENLIDNAIEFHSPFRKPEIFISTEEIQDYYCLSVADNGVGIATKNLEKIFSMLRKNHITTQGRGIGLYIVKRIIENEKGKIEVKSEEGKGAIFTVYFKK